MTKTLSSRAFHEDVEGAKRAALEGPVILTDRGRATHVLLSIEAYRRLVEGASIGERLALPGAEDVDFEAPRVEIRTEIPDLS